MAGKCRLIDYDKELFYEVPYWQTELCELLDLLEDLIEFYEESNVPENEKHKKIFEIKWQILKLDLVRQGLQSEGGVE